MATSQDARSIDSRGSWRLVVRSGRSASVWRGRGKVVEIPWASIALALHREPASATRSIMGMLRSRAGASIPQEARLDLEELVRTWLLRDGTAFR